MAKTNRNGEDTWPYNYYCIVHFLVLFIGYSPLAQVLEDNYGSLDMENELVADEIEKRETDDKDMGELPEYEDEVLISSTPDPLLPAPYIEWCEDGRRRRILSSQCQEVTFVPPFPSCHCLEGIISVQLDEMRNCETGLEFAKNLCFNFERLGHGARSLRFVRETTFRQTDSLVAVEEKSDGNSTWILRSPKKGNNRRVFIYNNVRLLNAELYQNGDGVNCIQKLNNGVTRVYKNVYGHYEMGMHRCPGFAIGDSRLVQEASLISPDFQFCSPSCPPFDESENPVENLQESILAERLDVCQQIPNELKSLHDDLNSRILRRSIEGAFKNPKSDPFIFKPLRSFRFLEQMVQITEKVCSKAGVSRRLLSTAVDLFRVAHEGRGYYFHEEFSETDYKHISSVLSDCLAGVRPLEFKRETCDGEVSEVFNGSTFQSLILSEEHTHLDHHVVLDVPWATIDLANVVCIDNFHHSYRSYHQLEQGMEKLYTKELRSFWLYPDHPKHLYERLLGSSWSRDVKNLRLCVQGSYLVSRKKMTPLNRPTWISGTGMRTRSQKICRRRRTNEREKMLSARHEIYCDALRCLSTKWKYNTYMKKNHQGVFEELVLQSITFDDGGVLGGCNFVPEEQHDICQDTDPAWFTFTGREALDPTDIIPGHIPNNKNLILFREKVPVATDLFLVHIFSTHTDWVMENPA